MGQRLARRALGLVLACAVFAAQPVQAGPAMARTYAVTHDLMQMKVALQMFRHDCGRYPTTQEGLAVLVTPTPELEASGKYPPNAYLERVPRDPWGGDYRYAAPGTRSGQQYDLWSYGADGLPGGEGVNEDVGNWQGSADQLIERMNSRERLGILQGGTVVGGLIGALLGLPRFVRRLADHRKQREAGAQASMGPAFAGLGSVMVAWMLLMILALDLFEAIQ